MYILNKMCLLNNTTELYNLKSAQLTTEKENAISQLLWIFQQYMKIYWWGAREDKP